MLQVRHDGRRSGRFIGLALGLMALLTWTALNVFPASAAMRKSPIARSIQTLSTTQNYPSINRAAAPH